jgi:hypothetical protein
MTSASASDGKARLILRVAASVATLQAAAHLVLFLRSQPRPGSAAWPLEQAMRMQAVPGHANYWGMYFGYGLLAAVTAFFIAALVWVLTTFEAGSRALTLRMTALTALVVAVHAAIIARYFFILPLLFDILIAVLLVFACLALRQSQRN